MQINLPIRDGPQLLGLEETVEGLELDYGYAAANTQGLVQSFKEEEDRLTKQGLGRPTGVVAVAVALSAVAGQDSLSSVLRPLGIPIASGSAEPSPRF